MLKPYPPVLLVLVSLAPVASGAVDAPTTATLSLDAVFTVAGPTAEENPADDGPLVWPVSDPRLPLVSFPPRELFIPPPTPVPTPTPEPLPIEFELPVRQPLAIQRRQRTDRVEQMRGTLLEARGTAVGGRDRLADIAIENTLSQIAMRLTLVPEASEGEVYRLMLAPGTGDRFSLPPGNYAIEREMWIPGEEGARLTERYDPQRIDAAGRYRLGAGGDEAALVRRLRSPLRG
jgi:hypothetical protein